MDWRALLAEEKLPAAVIDLDAVDRNAGTLISAIGWAAVTLRLASKSIRVPWLLRYLLDHHPRIRGVMAYSAAEAAALADLGFDDLLIAYPVSRAVDARIIAGIKKARVRAVVDHPDHVALLAEAARKAGSPLEVCLDVDAALRPLGDLHLGVRRSPVRTVEEALAVGKAVQDSHGVRLTAVMAYEAQVAGLQDAQANPLMGLAIAFLKGRSRPLAASRRVAMVEALRAQGHTIDVVNGGGTGSVAATSHDGSVTEVAAGSGFVDSHLFDGYAELKLVPAAFFAIPIVRRSDAGHVTAFGGGLIASGSTGPDRSPRVHWPTNLTPLSAEGWGEVQTPFRVGAGEVPALGDPVVARPAKAGEWLERFDRVLLIRNGRIARRERTYRGHGFCFG